MTSGTQPTTTRRFDRQRIFFFTCHSSTRPSMTWRQNLYSYRIYLYTLKIWLTMILDSDGIH